MKSIYTAWLLAAALLLGTAVETASAQAPEGFESIFNGRNFDGWQVPEGDNGHWRVVNGAIDYDAESEAEGDKSLYTEDEYGDYVLLIDWRIKTVAPYTNPRVPIILGDGTHKKDQDGNDMVISVPDSDSGIIPRGHGKAQHNIWNWPYGSGEVYGYRMDDNQPPAVRSAAVPLTNADNDIREWNTSEITVQGQFMTIRINGELVIDRIHLNEIPESGPIGLQHHGSKRDGEWVSPPSLVQFRNIYVKDLE
ncbi:MAG: DUF1080 domain-containing protein [Rhodothermales bacterium]